MKAITEAIIRTELKATQPEVYYIPEGSILTPAAREYLNQIQVEIQFERDRAKVEEAALAASQDKASSEDKVLVASPNGMTVKYTDYETGAAYMSKPEHMTQLFGNVLVDKNHPRIKYRGKLDRLQAEVVYGQALIAREEGNETLVEELGNILDILREMMKCEVLDEEFKNETIIGLTHQELREQSHNPMKFYNIKQMLLPEYSMGVGHSVLNLIRTSIRETEVMAVEAFKESRHIVRTDIIQELNRLSSALHIMMCKYLAGAYRQK